MGPQRDTERGASIQSGYTEMAQNIESTLMLMVLEIGRFNEGIGCEKHLQVGLAPSEGKRLDDHSPIRKIQRAKEFRIDLGILKVLSIYHHIKCVLHRLD